MHDTSQAERNAGHPHNEATAILMQMLHKDAAGVVLNTSKLAEILGKSEAALRLAEARYRARTGHDLLPVPLMKNGEGRIWSIAQIAEWMLGQRAVVIEANRSSKEKRGPGRPRKIRGAGGEQ